ncbi:MAG: PAS domain S-box protein [Acidobacteria bacterium]|nr:PAS domain S-box protein [Acidobacteriota bacterium]
MPRRSSLFATTSPIADSFVLAVCYIATGLLFRTPTLWTIANNIAWPAVGVGLAFLMVRGLALWPGLLLAAFVEPFLAGVAPPKAFGYAMQTVIELSLATWLLRSMAVQLALDRVRDVLRFTLVGVCAAPLFAVACNGYYGALIGLYPLQDVFSISMNLYRYEALGIFLFTPFLLTWYSDRKFEWLRGHLWEWAALILTLIPMTLEASGAAPNIFPANFPSRYLLFAWMIWAALRFGPPGVAFANLLVVVLAGSSNWFRLDSTSPVYIERQLLLWINSFFGCFLGLVLASLSRQQQRSRMTTDYVREANLAIARSLELPVVFDAVLTGLKKLVPYDSACILLLKGENLVLEAGVGYKEISGHTFVDTSFPVARHMAWPRLKDGQVFNVDDTQEVPGWFTDRGAPHVRSWLAVPLRVAGKTIGAYSLDKAEPNFFTAEHARLADSLSAQAALAIENAQLFAAQKAVEAALRDSESKLAAAFRSSPDAIAISRTSDSRIFDVNDRFMQFFGPRRENVIGKSTEDLGLWVDVAQSREMRQRVRDHGLIHDYECKFKLHDGQIRDFLFSAELVDLGGEQCIIGSARDITELKRAEEALRLSQEIFSKAFHSSPDSVTISTLAGGRFVEVNQGFLNLCGYTLQEVIGKTSEELGIFENIQERDVLLNHLKQNGTIRLRELRLRHRNGRILITQVSGEIIELKGQACLLAVVRDVTPFREMEDALRQSEGRYRDLFENANDIIFTLDPAGKYLSMNRMGEKIGGFRLSENKNLAFTDLVAPDHLSRAKELFGQILAGHVVRPFELDIITAAKKRIALEVSGRTIIEQGRVVGVQGIARDVTDRRLLEAQLRQSQKMQAVGLLAGGVAHDFNNLLAVILGYGEMLSYRLDPHSPLRAKAEEISNAAERAASLTRQLLAFSRKQVLSPRVLDLRDIVGEMRKMLQRLIGEHIQLETRADTSLDPVLADPGQLEQVIMNLAVNARDAMPEGGVLLMESANVELKDEITRRYPFIIPGRYVMLSISDTGVGMDLATQARIFEPFFTTKEVGKGTGLGLSTVYGIVKQSNGYILVESEINRGTIFRIYFPPASGQTLSVRGVVRQVDHSRNVESILLVEDEESLRNLLHEVLQDAGFRVYAAGGGAEALAISAQHRGSIDLLLADVVMPDMRGTDLAREIRKVRPRARILFMTGYSDEAILGNALQETGAMLLHKPVRPVELILKIRELLDSPSTPADASTPDSQPSEDRKIP